jgi:hypothetical protein
MNIIKKLPTELQTNIFILYWMDIFKENVVKELKNFKTTINNIYIYMCKHGIPNVNQGPNNSTISHHIYYFRKQNDFLIKFIKQKSGNHILCYLLGMRRETFNLYLKSNMFDSIPTEYRYISLFYLMFSPIQSGCNGYTIIQYFKNIPIKKYDI